MSELEQGSWSEISAEEYDPFDEESAEESQLVTPDASSATPSGETDAETTWGQDVDGAEAEAAPEPERPAEERIAELLEKMNGQRTVLLKILGLCRDQTSVAAVNESIQEWQRHNHSVFAPTTLCELLEQAGGLRHVNADGTDYVEQTQTAAQGVPPERLDEVTACGGADDPADATPDEAPLPTAGESPQAGDDETPALSEKEEDDAEVEFLEVEETPESYWVTTDAGRAIYDADDPRARVAKLLEDEAYYLPVYKEILEMLADEPRTKPQLDGVVRNHPLTQQPMRLTGYFVERLEKASAIEWADPWTITEFGREMLESEALYQ